MQKKHPAQDPLSGRIGGISRHRITTDGPGITTLVTMQGCRLHCRYCINPTLMDPEKIQGTRHPSADQFLAYLARDRLYFDATGGGICFGGGEPLLQADYLRAVVLRLRDLGYHWRITIETSLNVDQCAVLKLLDLTDLWFIDLKDMDPEIYRSYTGTDNTRVQENLQLLLNRNVILRLPKIPGMEDVQDRERSISELLRMGFRREQIDLFDYILPHQRNAQNAPSSDGK